MSNDAQSHADWLEERLGDDWLVTPDTEARLRAIAADMRRMEAQSAERDETVRRMFNEVGVVISAVPRENRELRPEVAKAIHKLTEAKKLLNEESRHDR